MTKSPSGALSPYYYKGGYFHGIHYGSYFDDSDALRSMMGEEEAFILKSPEQRRILVDLYETTLSNSLLEEFSKHIERMSFKIIKLAITSERQNLRLISRVLKKNGSLKSGQLYFCTDMEEAKTWLVSD